MVDMSLLTRLWLLTHHVFSSTQTNRGAITNGIVGSNSPAHRKRKILPARMPYHRWIPRAWASPACLFLCQEVKKPVFTVVLSYPRPNDEPLRHGCVAGGSAPA